MSYGNVQRRSSSIPIATPEYSTLYHLEPIGLGTADVEGLDSYLSRLAWRHNVKPSTLAGLIAESTPDVPESVIKTAYTQVRWCGLDHRAKSLVETLSSLTLHDRLSNLTFLPWEHVLNSKGLLKKRDAWCPLCYEEMYKVAHLTGH